jgi:nucleotide-binding universal stress UspA family protein
VRERQPDAIIRVGNLVSSEEDEMSIFPTRMLLAADGSAQAELATATAVDLARMFGSALHVVHVLEAAPSPALLYPTATDPEGAKISDQASERDLERRAAQLERQILDTDSERVKSAGGKVAGSHLAMGDAPREIVHLAEDLTPASS